ncbi:hypothetical protein MYXA107069_02065 [Myxococcus xanthus]|nr:hypothetical protein MyxoNM_12085 [Myxococcus xanthus]SDX02319.1 hypothetical protein SAMN05444383_104613 [Myxococcus xanthus]
MSPRSSVSTCSSSGSDDRLALSVPRSSRSSRYAPSDCWASRTSTREAVRRVAVHAVRVEDDGLDVRQHGGQGRTRTVEASARGARWPRRRRSDGGTSIRCWSNGAPASRPSGQSNAMTACLRSARTTPNTSERNPRTCSSSMATIRFLVAVLLPRRQLPRTWRPGRRWLIHLLDDGSPQLRPPPDELHGIRDLPPGGDSSLNAPLHLIGRTLTIAASSAQTAKAKSRRCP